MRELDQTARVRGSKEDYLGFEFEIARQSMSLVLDGACITELQDHLPKQDAARVHVWHRDDVPCEAIKRWSRAER